jgi:hypothetical protein
LVSRASRDPLSRLGPIPERLDLHKLMADHMHLKNVTDKAQWKGYTDASFWQAGTTTALNVNLIRYGCLVMGCRNRDRQSIHATAG